MLVDPYVSRVPLRVAAPAPAGAARRGADRPLRARAGRGGDPDRPHALGPRGRRAGDRPPRRRPVVRLGLARAADARCTGSTSVDRRAAAARYEIGPFVVSFTPSRHSKLLFGRKVPFDGPLTCEDLHGLSPGAYKCGDVFGIRIEVAGTSFYHQGSADLDDDAARSSPSTSSSPASPAARSRRTTGERILPRARPARARPDALRRLLRAARPAAEAGPRASTSTGAGRDPRGVASAVAALSRR